MAYGNVNADEIILRDHLAHERTVLANERTFLAYVRTAIALLAGGGTLVEVFPNRPALHVTGIVLLGLGGLVLAFGSWRFIVVARRLRTIYRGPQVGTRHGRAPDERAE